MSLNKVMLIGNLGKDPEVRFIASGKAVCEFPVATSEQWTDASGAKQERTEWHTVSIWGKQAEACGQYLAKGRQVFVEGSIATESWKDRDTGETKYRTKIKAVRVQFLGGRNGDTPAPAGPPPAAADDDAAVPF